MPKAKRKGHWKQDSIRPSGRQYSDLNYYPNETRLCYDCIHKKGIYHDEHGYVMCENCMRVRAEKCNVPLAWVED
jgi:hypothetical protein